MEAIILAGGQATRMGDATRGHPKALVPIAGHPLAEYQVSQLVRAGVERVIVSCGDGQAPLFEAKLSGLPSVVTPSGNLPDMIEHGRDGWVCSRADAEAIAEGLAAFLTQPDRLAAAGRAALASADRYDRGRFAS